MRSLVHPSHTAKFASVPLSYLRPDFQTMDDMSQPTPTDTAAEWKICGRTKDQSSGGNEWQRQTLVDRPVESKVDDIGLDELVRSW